MNIKILKSADNWFKNNNINTFILKNKMYVNMGNCELELSNEEIEFRAKINRKEVDYKKFKNKLK
jgi:hypothetical protein